MTGLDEYAFQQQLIYALQRIGDALGTIADRL